MRRLTGTVLATVALFSIAAFFTDQPYTRVQAQKKQPPVPEDISVRAFNSAHIDLPHNQTVTLTFNSERWDTANLHHTDPLMGPTSRLTAPVGGNYFIFAHVKFGNTSSAGTREVGIRVNGITGIAEERVNGNIFETGITGNVMTVGTNWRLTVGDYVEVQATQTSGTLLQVLFDPAVSPEFGVVKVD